MDGIIRIFDRRRQGETKVQKFSEKKKQWPLPGRIAEWILMFLLPAASFYLMEAFEHNAWKEVRANAQIYNIFLMELIAWFFFFLLGSAKWALRIQYLLALVFGLTNHYVMEFRSTPFVPWDLFSIQTAASVAENYDFTPSVRMKVIIGIFLAVLAGVELMRLRIPQKFGIRLIPAALAGLLLGLFVNVLQDEDFQTSHYLYPFLFTPAYMTKVNGMAVTFAMDLAFLVVEKPAGYDSQKAEALLASYQSEILAEEQIKTEQLPNIIVIMDEAFSDLQVLGDFTVSEDYMPFIHSLQQGAENTVSGTLHVSVCGGNTANTEFEFLTGNTMAFFPNGSIPYQQYITGKFPGIAGHLAELGYDTYAIHPYNASGWCRDEVYPLLGIETFYSLKDFYAPRYLRQYVSDESSFERIIDIYEQKEEGTPVFAFNVTMQNHGDYADVYENFTPDITVEGIDSLPLQQYLSLIKETDLAFQKLVDYFSEQEEPTVIVFFGDHQPANAVVYQILSKNGMDYRNLTQEQERLRYEVPYVIWANYDIEEETCKDTSVNYLGADVLKAAGVPLSAYQEYLLELQQEYPVISAIWQEGTSDSERLTQYQQLQYYLMFDWKE